MGGLSLLIRTRTRICSMRCEAEAQVSKNSCRTGRRTLTQNTGTFGVVTSAVVKAYPYLEVAESTLTFLGGNITIPTVVTNPSVAGLGFNGTFALPVIVKDLDNFWRGVSLFHAFGRTVVDGGGTTYSYTSYTGNNTFSFTTTIDMPRFSKPEIFDFVQPLFDSLNGIGIPVNNTKPTSSTR
jgi:hypothetical protein